MKTELLPYQSYSWKLISTKEAVKYTAAQIFFLANPLPCLPVLRSFQKHFPDHQVSTAHEAGCCGYSAHRSFESFGWKSLVVNPADIHRKGKERHTESDRIDAQFISRELKDGLL